MRVASPCPQGFKPYNDSRRAEPALRTTGVTEGLTPCLLDRRREAFDRGDLSAADPAGRSHTGNTRLTVNEHGATTALALGTATVFGSVQLEIVSQYSKQSVSGIGHFDLLGIHSQLDLALLGLHLPRLR